MNSNWSQENRLRGSDVKLGPGEGGEFLQNGCPGVTGQREGQGPCRYWGNKIPAGCWSRNKGCSIGGRRPIGGEWITGAGRTRVRLMLGFDNR